MNYDNYTETLIDINDNKEYSGLAFYIPDFSIYKDDLENYEITIKTQYRPDVIANDIYSDYSLSWVIDEINNFNHIKEYELGKVIKILPYNIVIGLGII
jgi:hypothetical protein